jgi:transposase, IS6 family
VFLSARRDSEAARRLFDRAIATTKVRPIEVVTDQAAAYPRVLDELVPARPGTAPNATPNNRIEADHGQLKRRLRPMGGLKTDAGASVVRAGHASVQNLRCGHYELGTDQPVRPRLASPSPNSSRPSDRHG